MMRGRMLGGQERKQFSDGEYAAVCGVPYNRNKPLQWRIGFCLKLRQIEPDKWSTNIARQRRDRRSK